MTTRYDCALNGTALSSLDARICVTDVIECAPVLRLTTAPRPDEGLHLIRRARESVTVQVRFLIHESRILQRRAVMQKILAWAEGGGVLTTCDRPGQQLTVHCCQTPAMSALEWLEEMTLSFIALCPPYWEAAEPVTVSTADTAQWSIPGTAPACPVEVHVLNQGDAPLTTLTLTSADAAITFSGLSLPAGGAIQLTWSRGVLQALAEGSSILLHRTDDSHDLLLATCGTASQVSVTADQSVLATFSARGRYL